MHVDKRSAVKKLEMLPNMNGPVACPGAACDPCCKSTYSKYVHTFSEGWFAFIQASSILHQRRSRPLPRMHPICALILLLRQSTQTGRRSPACIEGAVVVLRTEAVDAVSLRLCILASREGVEGEGRGLRRWMAVRLVRKGRQGRSRVLRLAGMLRSREGMRIRLSRIHG